jgi:hypothetical protein
MQSCATYDDINLVLKLYELRREEKLREARKWFSKEFHISTMEQFGKLCPPHFDSNAQFRMVVSYWEMASSFVVAGVLHPDIFFENTRELLVVYERLRPILAEMRATNGDPTFLKNLEQVGEQFVDWMKGRGDGVYEAFVKRVCPHR